MNEKETLHMCVQHVKNLIKIYRLEYLIGNCERLVRATVPIRVAIDDESKFYLLLSFDLKSPVIDVIEENVVLFIEKNNEKFV
jgi:hypothetical protein